MKLIKKSLAFASFVTLLSGTLAPAAFAQGTDISGNGALSSTNVTQTDTQTNTTVQNNAANFNNSISVSSNTGGNTADYNTGGNVGVGTGNSVTGVQVSNMANMNMANPDSAMSGTSTASPEMPVAITGNGAGSANTFSSSNTQDQTLYQTNAATFNNNVGVTSNTGGNSAAYGTNGNTTVMTGLSQTGIGIQNTANGNTAGTGMSSSAMMPMASVLGNGGTTISNNGALSANAVGITNSSTNLTEQYNDAAITNSVAVSATTGDNTASQNTGGSQLVTTGMAALQAGISNLANFNSASLPADSWINSTDPTVSGNGAYSTNTVDLAQSRTNSLFQGSGEGDGNQFTANNALSFAPSTGANTASLNTLPLNGISEVLSGTSASSVSVNNAGNVNSAGSHLGSLTLPGGMQLNLGFNLGSLLHL